jgi:hypothetical protein
MSRIVRFAILSVAFSVVLQAATLERLTLNDMIEKSTAIVRARVIGSHSSFRGLVIYTHFTLQVLERWKGEDSSQVEIVVPGGTARGLHQSFSGTPRLVPGNEYVFFLWAGRSGLTHVIGLSQGVFGLTSDDTGGMIASRAASTEAMIDSKTGQVVSDETLRMKLRDLRSRVNDTLARRASR